MGHTYVSREFGSDGLIDWTHEENSTWQTLSQRQHITVHDRACDEFIDGLATIDFPSEHIPTHMNIDQRLIDMTGWRIVGVPAIIPNLDFYTLLSEKRFPVTCFIRIPEELDYLEEPDIFHELFGHIPFLTWQRYADFLEKFGKAVCESDSRYHIFFFRIFWYTVEFGLISTDNGMKIYGAGILSSHGETIRSLDIDIVQHTRFDVLRCARTSYRYDVLQSEYFFIESFDELFTIFDHDLMAIYDEAIRLGDIT